MTIDLITSPANPLLKEIRRVQEQGGLTEQGWLIAEGPHLVAEAVRSGLRIVCAVIDETGQLPQNLTAGRVIQVPSRVFRSISGTVAPQGVMALAEPPTHVHAGDTRHALTLVLDQIQDPGNAGTMARSAEAFGASKLIFLSGTVHPLSPKTLRASAGSLFRVPFERQPGVLRVEPSMRVYAGVADPHAPAAWDCDFRQPCAIVIGNEGNGVSAAVLREAEPVRIPTRGVESLNASIAASVLLYEAHRQRGRG